MFVSLCPITINAYHISLTSFVPCLQAVDRSAEQELATANSSHSLFCFNPPHLISTGHKCSRLVLFTWEEPAKQMTSDRERMPQRAEWSNLHAGPKRQLPVRLKKLQRAWPGRSGRPKLLSTTAYSGGWSNLHVAPNLPRWQTEGSMRIQPGAMHDAWGCK